MAEQIVRKPFRREIPRLGWVLRHPRYMRYMAREVTCLFIGAYTLLLVVGMKSLSEGQVAYDAFLDALRSPVSILLHVVALGFATYHSVTWFNLTPKALPLLLGDEFVADRVISGAHFGAWAVLSLVLIILAGAF